MQALVTRIWLVVSSSSFVEVLNYLKHLLVSPTNHWYQCPPLDLSFSFSFSCQDNSKPSALSIRSTDKTPHSRKCRSYSQNIAKTSVPFSSKYNTWHKEVRSTSFFVLRMPPDCAPWSRTDSTTLKWSFRRIHFHYSMGSLRLYGLFSDIESIQFVCSHIDFCWIHPFGPSVSLDVFGLSRCTWLFFPPWSFLASWGRIPWWNLVGCSLPWLVEVWVLWKITEGALLPYCRVLKKWEKTQIGWCVGGGKDTFSMLRTEEQTMAQPFPF